jgi:hypothetical protein
VKQNDKGFGSKISFRTFGYCFGWIEGSDSFSKYTQNHMVIDLLIQGAGAGSAVTARGVF